MTSLLIAALTAPLALQASTAQAPAKPSSFADLPVEEATAPRCGIAFGLLEGWQQSGDPRGEEWRDISTTNAREFFVQAMVRLIDTYSLERDDVTRMVALETQRHEADAGASVTAMLPACLALLDASSPPSG